MSFENEFDNFKDTEELTKILGHLIEECCGNLDVEQMEEVKRRFKMVCENGIFWVNTENQDRLAYDLRDFGMWLCDYIADREREFWGE